MKDRELAIAVNPDGRPSPFRFGGGLPLGAGYQIQNPPSSARQPAPHLRSMFRHHCRDHLAVVRPLFDVRLQACRSSIDPTLEFLGLLERRDAR